MGWVLRISETAGCAFQLGRAIGWAPQLCGVTNYATWMGESLAWLSGWSGSTGISAWVRLCPAVEHGCKLGSHGWVGLLVGFCG